MLGILSHGPRDNSVGYLIGPSGDNTYSDLGRSDYILIGFLFFNHFQGGYFITPTVRRGPIKIGLSPYRITGLSPCIIDDKDVGYQVLGIKNRECRIEISCDSDLECRI